NQPGNFSGSIYDALDSTGLFNYFILGVDTSEYGNQLKNTLVTVIAPSDKAFEDYLEKHGYNSISGIPKNKLQNLIGHHIITWPQEPDIFREDPNLFKRQTNMPQDTVIKYDIISETDRTVHQESKYLQFYCPEILNYYEGTEDDYYILTGTEISPATGFNIYDVPVDSILPYGNGWVYYVDQVIEPFQNLDDWLMNSSDNSLLCEIFNRFSIYVYDGYYPTPDPIKRSSLFKNQRHYRIDMELCFETVGSLEGLSDVRIFPKARSNFTVLAPENDALISFIDSTFTNYPGFKDSISFINQPTVNNLHKKAIVRAIISPYMFLEQIIWPSDLYDGNATGNDGTSFMFSPQDISEYTMCSNGYAYKLKSFVTPRTFQSILKPVYTTPEYKYMTTAIDRVEIQNYLNDKDANYTLLLPTDEAFIKNNIFLLTYDDYISAYGPDPEDDFDNDLNHNDLVIYSADTTGGNTPGRIGDQDLFELIFAHLFVESVNPTSQKQYALNAPGAYVGITENSAWSGGNLIGKEGSRAVVPNIIESFTESVDNGKVYVIDDLIQMPKYTIGELISEYPAYSRFKDLCENAGLLDAGILEVYGDKPTVFIPTNDAIDQYIDDGKLPIEETALQNFIKYFFVDGTIFTSETINETFATLSVNDQLSTKYKIVYRTAELNGTYENLQIKGSNNTSYLNVIEGSESNVICTDGIIHQIDGVLN
ncbi:MAG: fasciclin domain-containing protein, partial [Bacteroidales bacterium]